MTKLLQKAFDEAARLPERDQDALASLLLEVNSDLVDKASELGVDLAATLAHALALEIRRRQGENWRQENREAIEAYNEHVEQHGVFSTGLRAF